MANDKTQVLYNQLVKDGYDLGDYNTFESKLQSPDKAKLLHDTIVKDGYDVGDFDTFYSKVSTTNPLARTEKQNFALDPAITIPAYEQNTVKATKPTTTVKNENSNYPVSDWLGENISQGLGDFTKGLAVGIESIPDQYKATLSDWGRVNARANEANARLGLQTAPDGTVLPLLMDEENKNTLQQAFKEQAAAGDKAYDTSQNTVKDIQKNTPQNWQGSAGAMTPLALTTVIGMATGQPEIVGGAVTAHFMTTGYSQGMRDAEDYASATGQTVTDDQKRAMGIGTAFIYGPGLGMLTKGAGTIFKGMTPTALKEAVQVFSKTNPELVAKTGQQILKSFATKNAIKQGIKTELKEFGKGAAHSVGVMTGIGAGSNVLQGAVLGKEATFDEWVGTLEEGVKSGLMFTAMTLPFARMTARGGYKNVIDNSEEVTVTTTDKGQSVIVMPTRENGKTFGITPEGTSVEVSQPMVDRSITMTSKLFKNTVNTARKTGEVSPTIERDAYADRLENQLKKIASTVNGNITTITDTDGNRNYMVGVDKEGNLLGVDGNGSVSSVGALFRPEIKVGDELPSGTVIEINDKTITVQPKTVLVDNVANPIPEPIKINRSQFDEVRYNDPEAKIEQAHYTDVHKSIMNEWDKLNNNITTTQNRTAEDLKAIEQAKRQQDLTDLEQRATDIVTQHINPDTNTLLTANVMGKEQVITKGKLVTKEDGTIDVENSDKEFYYVDENGKTQVAPLEHIDSVVENVPYEEALNQAKTELTAPLQAQHANEDVRPYEQGEQVRLKDNQLGVITGKTETGYTFQDERGIISEIEPRSIVNEDNIKGLEGGETVNYDDNGTLKQGTIQFEPTLRRQGSVLVDGNEVPIESVQPIKTVEETPENEPIKAVSTDNTTQSIEQSAPVETAPVPKTFKEQIPVTDLTDKKGNAIGTTTHYEQAPVETTIGALNEQFEPEEVKQVVQAKISKLQSDLSKLGKVKITGDIDADAANKAASKQAVSEINTKLMYWNDVNNTLQPKQEVQETVITSQQKPRKQPFVPKLIQNIVSEIGEPKTLRELIMHKLMTGTKLKWDDVKSETGAKLSKGVSSEYKGSLAEKKQRSNGLYGYIETPTFEGLTPEQLAHEIWQANAYEEGSFEDLPLFGLDTQDILNEIHSVVRDYPTTGKMAADLLNTHGKISKAEKQTINNEVQLESAEQQDNEEFENNFDEFINNPEQNPFFVNEITPEQDELYNYFSSIGSESAPTARNTDGNIETKIKGNTTPSAIEPTQQQPGVGSGIDNGGINPSNEGIEPSTDSDRLDAYISSQEHNNNPTEKQKETGVYDKARINLQHHNITLETLKGQQRSGVDTNGKEWSVTMNNHYGELDGTIGYDGDPIDVFVGPDPNQGEIFVIDQVSKDGSFDESKVMLGFDSAEQAKEAYLSNFEKGWTGFGSITLAGDKFNKWLYDGKKQRKPYSEYKDTPEAIEKVANSEINSNFAQNNNNELPQSVSQGEFAAQNEGAGRTEEIISECKRRSEEALRNAQENSGVRKEQVIERTIEQYAKENDLWVPITTLNDLGEPLPSGNESDVFLRPETHEVFKVNNLTNTQTLFGLFDSITSHNNLFPETTYTIVGFTGFDNGTIYPILKQNYVANATEATDTEIEDYMKNMGFEKTGRARFSNGEIEVSDLYPRNVLKSQSGEIYVIDNILKSDTSQPKTTEKLPETQTEQPNKQQVTKNDMTENSLKSEPTSVYDEQISKLESEKIQVRAKKDKLIKELADRNGLFGDTKADPTDLFGGEGEVDTQAASDKLGEYNARMSEIDRQIAELKKSAETGAKEAEGQTELLDSLTAGEYSKAKSLDDYKQKYDNIDTSKQYTDAKDLKIGDYAQFSHPNGTKYAGIVVSKGTKNVKLQSPYGYNDTSLTETSHKLENLIQFMKPNTDRQKTPQQTPEQRFDSSTDAAERHAIATKIIRDLEQTLRVGVTPVKLYDTTENFLSKYKEIVSDSDYKEAVKFLASGQQLSGVRIGEKVLINVEHNKTATDLIGTYMHETGHKAFDIVFSGENLDIDIEGIESFIPDVYWGEDNRTKISEAVAHQIEELLNDYTPEQIKNGNVDVSLLDERIIYPLTKTLNKLSNGKISIIGTWKVNDIASTPGSNGGIQADGNIRNDSQSEVGSNQSDNGIPETERDRKKRELAERLKSKLKPDYKRYEIPKNFKDNIGVRRELSGGVSIIENFPNEETMYQWEEKQLPEWTKEAIGIVDKLKSGKYLVQEEIKDLATVLFTAKKHAFDGWDFDNIEDVYTILVYEGYIKPVATYKKEEYIERYNNIRTQSKPLFKRFDPELNAIAMELSEMIFEEGDVSFESYSAQMLEYVGEQIRPLLKPYYEMARVTLEAPNMTSADEVHKYDITNFNHKEYVSNRAGSGKQDSPRTNEIHGDAEIIPTEGSGSGQVGNGIAKNSVRKGGRGRSTSNSSVQPSLFGEQSDIEVPEANKELSTEKPVTGDTDGRGNGIDSTEGHSDFDGRANESDNKADVGVSETFKQRVARKLIEQQKAESIPVKSMDINNIRETLPFLLSEQQDDVLKAETRFFVEAHQNKKGAFGKGMLFTNGTGTGKTYTGLGIAKRFAKQGKGNILIVVPSEAKVLDWAKDGKNLGLEITPLSDTKDAGTGAIVTTYANFRANEALKERDFDLVMYDESHRLMEEKTGKTSSTTNAHYAHSNVTEWQALHRIQSVNPDYIKIQDLYDKLKHYGQNKDNQLAKAIEKDLDERLKAYNENVKPVLEARAKQAYNNTKVVFLSATPFKAHFNLRYANGSLFDWGNETTYASASRGQSRVDAESQFFLDNFGSAYEWKFHRLQSKKNSNAEAIAMQEVQFAENLIANGAMSGRAIESDKDYSREFPRVTLDNADTFNTALNEIMSNDAPFGALRDAAMNVFRDYNYTTKLFESLKASMSIPRIQDHLDLGRKLVIFHRRKQADVLPPFQSVLDMARTEAQYMAHEAQNMEDGQKKDELNAKIDLIYNHIEGFQSRYADLLKWEQTLDYSPAIDQLKRAFGEKVVFINGDTSKKDKPGNINKFNDDNSEVKIIVVQEEAGKEGISLHDTTGMHPRVLMNLSLPISSTTTLQIEGRVYRIGQESNVPFEYPLLGIDQEISDFGNKINKKLSTTENLAMGNQARDLLRSFAEGVLFNQGTEKPNLNQGAGGKEYDKKTQSELSEFRKAVLVYQSNQKVRGSRDSREGKDYYATPEPVGQKMVEFLGLQAGESAMEPSAGHGAIAMWFPDKVNSTVIEPSYSLYTKLNARAGGGNRKMVNDIFENYNIINKYHGIAMNPPFGSGGKTAVDHVEKAFGHLHNNGRVVAIIPQGQADKRLDDFLDRTPNAHLIASIKLPSSTFEQAGTSVSTRIVVIDRVDMPSRYSVKNEVLMDNFRKGKLAETHEQVEAEVDNRLNDFRNKLPRTQRMDLSFAENIDELFNEIEDLSVEPRQRAVEEQAQADEAVLTKGKFEQFEQKHGKTGENMFMVAPTEFHEKEVYNKLVSIAKENNGYYSSYSSKPQNVRSGFTFKTKEDADNFSIAANKELSNPEFKIIGEKGATALDKAEEATTRLDNLRVAKEMEKGIPENVIKDKNGKPVTFYHGTNVGINKFEKSKLSEATRYGKGFSFTDGKGIADEYAYERAGGEQAKYIGVGTPTVIEVNLTLNKPFDVTNRIDTTTPEAKKLISILTERYGKFDGWVENMLQGNGRKDAFTELSNGIFDKDKDEKIFMFAGNPEKLRGIIEESGYDGIIGEYQDANEYFVFNPEQIHRSFTPQEIRLATGWEKGVDGLWRYEVPDIDTKKIEDKLLENATDEGKSWDVFNLSEFNEISKAYPEINVDATVWLSPEHKNTGSYTQAVEGDDNYFGRSAEINVYVNDVKNVRSVLVHEIQHAIQGIEGFAQGGNPSMFNNAKNIDNVGLYSIFDKIKSVKPKTIDELKLLKDKILGDNPYMYEMDDWNRVIRKVESASISLNDIVKTPYERYNELAGEVEARNASARMNMTEEERRNTLLAQTADVAPEDQIVIMDNLGVSNSIPPTISGLAAVAGENIPERLRDELDAKLEKGLNKLTFKLREAYSDEHLAVKELLDVLRNNGTSITPLNDWYMRSTAIGSMNDAQLNVYEQRLNIPLMKEVSKLEKKSTYREIENYIMLKHGIERNEFMREAELKKHMAEHPKADEEANRKKLENKDYAGVKAIEEEIGLYADEYIRDFEKLHDTTNLWNLINAATRNALETQYNNGLINKSILNELLDRYNYYIPLRGFDKEIAEDRYDYSPDMGTRFSAPLIKAYGRTSRPEMPFAYIFQINHSAISQGNKNTLNQTILRLARLDKSGLLIPKMAWYKNMGLNSEGQTIWEMQSPEYSPNADEYTDNINRFEDEMKDLETQGLATQKRGGLNIGLFVKPKQAVQHEVNVYENGVHHVVYINANPKVARAINGENRVEAGKFFNAISVANRWMAANFTSRNPLFMISNFERDLTYSATTLGVKEGVKYQAQFVKNIPMTVKSITNLLAGKGNVHDKYDQYAIEFVMNGGKTGYTQIVELKSIQKRIEKEIKKGKIQEPTFVFKAFEMGNQIAENTTRLATYITSREAGRSVIESISNAKEVTVNFNRKGSGALGADEFRKTFLFFNVAIQALENVMKTTKNNPFRMAGLLASFVASGVLAPMLSMMLGGDEAEEAYNNLSEWDRQNNMCIWTGDGFIKWALPQELRVFHALGDNVYRYSKGKTTGTELLVNTMLGLTDLLPVNPLGATKMEDKGWKMAANSVTPDLMKPFTQLAMNVTYTGGNVYNSYANNADPGFVQSSKNKKGEPYAPAILVWGTQQLDKLSGGDGVMPGKISPNPDVINHLVRGYYGGLYTMFIKTIDSSEKLAEGKTIKVRDTPISSFYTSKDDIKERNSALMKEYNDIREQVSDAKHYITSYKNNAKDLYRKGSDPLTIAEYQSKIVQLSTYKLNAINNVVKTVSRVEEKIKDSEEPEKLQKIATELKRYVIKINDTQSQEELEKIADEMRSKFE